MPDSITTAFVKEYKGAVEILLQQEGSKLRGAVSTDSFVGESAAPLEQFGPTAAEAKTSRHTPTPVIDVPQARRWIFPADYHWATLVDKQDRLRMQVDPTKPYVRNGMAAMAREWDDALITGFFATATTGKTGTGSESFDTSSYRVGVDVGGTASGLNVAKLQNAMLMLQNAHYGDLMEQPYIAISPYEHDLLLKEIQVVNADFNGGMPVLVNGKIDYFMGFKFIVTTRLNITGGNRLVPFWVPSGMIFGVWNDLQAEMSVRDDLSYAEQVYLCSTFGATRTQQGKVGQILCDDQI